MPLQQILVFVSLGAASAFLIKKLFLHDLLAKRRPHVPVGNLVRKQRSGSGPSKPPSCH